MPAVPRKRGVSRARYDRMVLDALASYNAKVDAENVELSVANAKAFLDNAGGPNNRGRQQLKRHMIEHDAFHSRQKNCALLRFRIFRELHDAGYSYPSIALAAGGFDHTTILSGVRKINLTEPLTVLVAEVAERPSGHAHAYNNVAIAELAQGTTNLDEALALIEVRAVAVAA